MRDSLADFGIIVDKEHAINTIHADLHRNALSDDDRIQSLFPDCNHATQSFLREVYNTSRTNIRKNR